MRTSKRKVAWSVIGAMGFWLLALAFGVLSTELTASALPPRPSPEPVILVQETGGYIKLQVEEAPAGLWTIVQWKDGLDNWHNVDGWQGTLDDGVTKAWWVAPKDFDTGPFRWAAYDEAEGELLAASSEFQLPSSKKQVVLVDLSFAPETE